MDQNADIFPAYRLVAQFADGQRLTFDGLTEQQAQTRMEAAQALHGDICWYDGVTDQHYENGHFYKLTPLSRRLLDLFHGIQTAYVITQSAMRNKQSIGCHHRVD